MNKRTYAYGETTIDDIPEWCLNPENQKKENLLSRCNRVFKEIIGDAVFILKDEFGDKH